MRYDKKKQEWVSYPDDELVKRIKDSYGKKEKDSKKKE